MNPTAVNEDDSLDRSTAHHRQKLLAQLECLAGIMADIFEGLSKEQQAFYEKVPPAHHFD